MYNYYYCFKSYSDNIMKLILASNNEGKIKEIYTLISPLGIKLLTQDELNVNEIEETGTTFYENALLKAQHAYEQTGLACIADDSGLCIESLSGEPGVYSARYAGLDCNPQKNIHKVISQLKQLPEKKHPAYFHCTIIYLHPDHDKPFCAEGKWAGEIILTPKGSNGFGYDPIFYLPEYKCTAAELSSEIKNTISHRAIALKTLKQYLKSIKIIANTNS